MRQTGSAIKPFVYLAALDHGFTPSTLVLDGPLVARSGAGPAEMERRRTTSDKFSGPMPLRGRRSRSRSTSSTARVGGDRRPRRGRRVCRELRHHGSHAARIFDVARRRRDDAAARSPPPTRCWSMAASASSPTLIDRVQDRNGVTIYRADQRACDGCSNVDWNDQAPPELPDTREQIVDPRSRLSDRLDDGGRRAARHRRAASPRSASRSPARPARPTTGNDTWFVGFSPDLVAGVFVGFDQPRQPRPAARQAPAVAAPVFRDFMIGGAEGRSRPTGSAFRRASQLVRVNPDTGAAAAARRQAARSTKPSSPAPSRPRTDTGVVVERQRGVPGGGTVTADDRDGARRSAPAASAGAAPAGCTGTGGSYTETRSKRRATHARRNPGGRRRASRSRWRC